MKRIRGAEAETPAGPPGAGAGRLRAGWCRLAAAALVTLISAGPAWCAQVSALAALHHDGQTFITWTCPGGIGWTYRVYRAPLSIEQGPDLATAALLGAVSDSTWCDRRLSSLSGTVYGYAVDSLAAPLNSTRGMFVWTPVTAGNGFYAVTCQAPGAPEDSSIASGENALGLPVAEIPQLPRPVYQRTLIGPGGAPADVYTLWVGDRDAPFMPAMCNRPSVPYDCSIRRGTPGGGLMFHAHVRGGSFYLASAGSGTPGEWVITMDDFVRTPDYNTFWFGFHEGYEIEKAAVQPNPTAGTVQDNTARRVIFTLEWARRSLPVDTSRVYVMGASMGAIAGVFLAMWRPDMIAATMVNVPLFDFSFENDPNPLCQFNVGGGQRWTCDHLWGEVGTDLRMGDGSRVYDRLNCGALAAGLEDRFVPPMITFSGRNDVVLGWAEKIPFYHAMNDHRGGGSFFWDTRTHSNTATAGAWWPVQNYRYVYRFRTNLSFPALSNCSADGDPGDGHAADGDSIGTINGFVEWDSTIVDESAQWRVRLTLRDLATLWGPIVRAPDSVTVDVTPRRLQRFVIAAGREYAWHVSRSSDSTTVQSGMVRADALGVVTVPGAQVFRAGSVLVLEPPPVLDAGGSAQALTTHPRIGPLPCPLRGACAVTIEWPGAGEATVEILDAAGRRVGALLRGPVESGRQETRLDPGGLANGIYFVRARVGGVSAVRRFAVIR